MAAGCGVRWGGGGLDAGQCGGLAVGSPPAGNGWQVGAIRIAGEKVEIGPDL